MYPYGTEAWLNDMRLLLLLGFAAATLLWVVLNWPDDRKAVVADPTCKVHQRPESQCRGMHDQ